MHPHLHRVEFRVGHVRGILRGVGSGLRRVGLGLRRVKRGLRGLQLGFERRNQLTLCAGVG